MHRSFSELAYAATKKVTRRDRLLSQIDVVTSWAALVSALAPHYPKSDQGGRLPIGLERTLRMYVAQQCFGLSDEGIQDAPGWRRRFEENHAKPGKKIRASVALFT